MKIEIKKEIKYALRNERVLILLVFFLFFALLTPIMLKVVIPLALKSQFVAGESLDIGNIINMTQLGCMQSYIGDVFEIGTIIIALTLCGLTALEIRDNTWVLPICGGKKFEFMVGAKFIVFGILLIMVSVIALFVDYGYSGILFGFEIGVIPVLYSGLLLGIYMLFLLSCLIMWGVLMKRPIPAGVITIALAYGIHLISSLLRIQTWTPSGLLIEAQTLNPTASLSLLVPILVTFILIILMTKITISKLKVMEWNERTI